MYLSVIVPAYNEAEKLPKTLKRFQEYLFQQAYSYEIIVVNDGARDNTADVVRNMERDIKNLRFIDRKKNMGKGYTVREGMLAAYGRIRLFADADNATDISHFDKMRPFFDKGFDAVICSRDPKDALGAKQAVAQAWWKRALGNMGNLYIQWMAVPGIWDTQCGFKAFRDYAAEKIFSATKINRWAFDVEVLALAKRFGYKIGIIPANWVNDPRSSVKFMAYFHTLWEVFKIRRLLNKLKI
ncbi:hypothetical protein A3B05_02170 [Candidatus Giovannonibacteria bacterium RIFCSPLOWO2_01_FULL_43_160]|uniref:dolichyl-phosphate beta-glucosyltransferase n=1 Tax=Candidatus Giovannonibacteria bacterium RIFCSPLOWO2_12_FULL_43_26 TaxID=1798363 RepID=A0A1F5XV13_9BACT|nr:MAG: hypothetical protein A2652_02120 [Candidatus Giovannonibacteria bacterium RIFCSPHIGHO2_01_FULL_43_140]OGF70077.1 MAG: hypothetical protein A3C76_02290 [Candidatus Giovannonibacteria bacterium RIFCSPHIGHO2_02_FULL_44_51]OGF72090.1 MAG: hypothetical protein A3E35_03390 [Candidatus Giovannonibacteria bacterium RIFCSPHIGHO2_12_FULL_44_22]OGF75502.1 MAG: hypothetical protein A3B05_02170 [Candidatus Giovannonibacteria bacterium RIFCSPLOWO2_01_FULL_43_160]OGF85873.1 MAG: hypothetical protein A